MATHMIGTNGMKTHAEWGALGEFARRDWLAGLTPLQVRAQASVQAAGTQRTIHEVITAWSLMGYLSIDAAAAALASEVAS